jgi:outer membrane biosynthesis protein TonB
LSPKPTATPRPTTPKPTATTKPKATATPKATAKTTPTKTPKPSATPKPTKTPKPTATPKAAAGATKSGTGGGTLPSPGLGWLVTALVAITAGYAIFEFRHDLIAYYHRFVNPLNRPLKSSKEDNQLELSLGDSGQ